MASSGPPPASGRESLEETVAARRNRRERSASVEAPASAASAADERRVGGFRLVRLLGEGGMGSVFLAEQDEPVHRTVALKLIRSSIAGPVAAARFDAERQALARLSHPNVAVMYEAGATAEGFPFFVMELVDGVPITAYCDQHRLTIRERMEIFIDICKGVQHAHQKGLIHRDLKPSNVLVVDVEGKPTPKVIDFGVAKALDQPLTDANLRTRGAVIGTPGYMSPEALSGDDLDTRTDVYSLGVLLYEILTGTRPHKSDGIPFAMLMRSVAESDPLAPRALFRTLDAAAQATIADARRESAQSLERTLGGDLAWIALKAIGRERETRYASSGELAADVLRHLRDEPVVATPPSFTYSARKFARRHRAAVIAASIVIVTILAGTAMTTVSMLRAQRARSEATAISQFLLNTLAAASPWQRKSETTVRELLDEAADRVPRDLRGQPAAQAELLSAIGSSQFHLGRLDDAERNLREALRLRILVDGKNSTLVARLQNDLGMVLKHRDDLGGAERLLRESLVIREKLNGRMHGSVARGLFDLGSILEQSGNATEAEACLRESLSIRETLFARGSPDVDAGTVALTWAGLGGFLARKGRLAEAERMLRRSIELRDRANDHGYAWARAAIDLGDVLTRQNRAAEAEILERRAIAVLETFIERGDARLGEAHIALGHALRGQHKLAESEAVFQRVITEFQVDGERHVLALALSGLAEIRREQGRDLEAADLNRRALAATPNS
ncbi:MAG TPA: serine/threonine-protein kinase [Thermoanaerobaculia bacterium]|nr:serine/threonine-protein kinase [Thermoanaerobaculia bacterium]